MSYELQKVTKFDFGSAEDETHYQLWRTRKNWRGKDRATLVMNYGYGGLSCPYVGDLEWAKKIAKKFKIGVPA